MQFTYAALALAASVIAQGNTEISANPSGIIAPASGSIGPTNPTLPPSFLIDLDISITINGSLLLPNGEPCPCELRQPTNCLTCEKVVVYTVNPTSTQTICPTCQYTCLPTGVPTSVYVSPLSVYNNFTVTSCPTQTATVTQGQQTLATGSQSQVVVSGETTAANVAQQSAAPGSFQQQIVSAASTKSLSYVVSFLGSAALIASIML